MDKTKSVKTTKGTYLGYSVVRKAHGIGEEETFHYFIYNDKEELVGSSKRPYTNRMSLFLAFSNDVENMVRKDWWDKSVLTIN